MRRLVRSAGAATAGIALVGAAALGFAGPAAASSSGAAKLPDYHVNIWHIGTFTAGYCLVAEDPATGEVVDRQCGGPAKSMDKVDLRVPREDTWWRMSLDIDVERGEPVRHIVISSGYNEALDDHVGAAYVCRTYGDGVHIDLKCFYDEQLRTFYRR